MLKLFLASAVSFSSLVVALDLPGGDTIECTGKTDGDYCLNSKTLYGCQDGDPSIIFACNDGKVCVSSTNEVGKAQCVAETAQ